MHKGASVCKRVHTHPPSHHNSKYLSALVLSSLFTYGFILGWIGLMSDIPFFSDLQFRFKS